MTAKYCLYFFYPEAKHSKCEQMLSVSGRCNAKQICQYQLNLNKEGFAILDSLRIVKKQNAEILLHIRGNQRKK